MIRTQVAHCALAHDWSNFSFETISNSEWLVGPVLCLIASSQRAILAILYAALEKGTFHRTVSQGSNTLLSGKNQTYRTTRNKNDEKASNSSGVAHDPRETNKKNHTQDILKTRQIDSHQGAHLRCFTGLKSTEREKSNMLKYRRKHYQLILFHTF